MIFLPGVAAEDAGEPAIWDLPRAIFDDCLFGIGRAGRIKHAVSYFKKGKVFLIKFN